MLPMAPHPCPLSWCLSSLQALLGSLNSPAWRGRRPTQIRISLDLGQATQHSGVVARWGGAGQDPDAPSQGKGSCAMEGPGHVGVRELLEGGGEGRGDDCTGKSLWSFLASASGATSFSPTGCLPESLPTHQQIKRRCHLLANGPVWPQCLHLFAPGWKVRVWVWWSYQDLFLWAFLLPDSAASLPFVPPLPLHPMLVLSPVTGPTPLLQGQRQLQALRGPHMAPSI